MSGRCPAEPRPAPLFPLQALPRQPDVRPRVHPLQVHGRRRPVLLVHQHRALLRGLLRRGPQAAGAGGGERRAGRGPGQAVPDQEQDRRECMRPRLPPGLPFSRTVRLSAERGLHGRCQGSLSSTGQCTGADAGVPSSLGGQPHSRPSLRRGCCPVPFQTLHPVSPGTQCQLEQPDIGV